MCVSRTTVQLGRAEKENMSHRRKKGGLGRALVKARNKSAKKTRAQKKLLRKAQSGSQGVDGEYVDYGGLNGLTSVTELSSLDEFIASARLADRQFATERHNAVVVESTSLGNSGDSKLDSHNVNNLEPESLKIPRRPEWSRTMTAAELDKEERKAFLDWRRKLAILEEAAHVDGRYVKVVTPFEKNIEFWRQLWRVMEKSDLVVQIVDARNPLLFYCPDIDAYTRELVVRMQKEKESLLIINKADFLSEKQRGEWAAYFRGKGIDFIFFSAKAEQEKLDECGEDQESDADSIWNLSESKRDAPIHRSNSADLLGRGDLVETLADAAIAVAAKNEVDHAMIGMVGYPNVGKSSLINVLLGDMSLVGPRPELLDYTKRYKGDEIKILKAKPGITDYSSIHFFSQETFVGKKNAKKVFDKKILPVKNSLRLKYVNEKSLYTDIKILVLTFLTLLKKIIKIG